jgi:hypothetical protein
MMLNLKLNLTAQEAKILADVLENDYADLGLEIADADRLEFREFLEQRRGVVEKTMHALDLH